MATASSHTTTTAAAASSVESEALALGAEAEAHAVEVLPLEDAAPHQDWEKDPASSAAASTGADTHAPSDALPPLDGGLRAWLVVLGGEHGTRA